jgi:hypothetical protein
MDVWSEEKRAGDWVAWMEGQTAVGMVVWKAAWRAGWWGALRAGTMAALTAAD